MSLNVLAFFAHPDDETLLAGGTLALLAARGAQVHYLCCTRGEGGEVGDPPGCTIEELGAVREKELVFAVQALGGCSLTFLGYTDPRIGPNEELYPFTDNLTILAGQLATTIEQFGANVVITHGSNGEYGHPAHVLCHQAALAAVLSLQDLPNAPLLYTAGALSPNHPNSRMLNKDDAAHLVVDISRAFEKKEKAILCHKTQHALFLRWAYEDTNQRVSVSETVGKTEALRRVLPEMKQGEEIEDELMEILRKARS